MTNHELNEAARISLLKGASPSISLFRMTHAISVLDAAKPCGIWYERVPSFSNHQSVIFHRGAERRKQHRLWEESARVTLDLMIRWLHTSLRKTHLLCFQHLGRWLDDNRGRCYKLWLLISDPWGTLVINQHLFENPWWEMPSTQMFPRFIGRKSVCEIWIKNLRFWNSGVLRYVYFWNYVSLCVYWGVKF